MGEFNYKIIKKIGLISNDSKWKKELNLISWDGRARKFDIRNWDENHENMSKGITLTKDELTNLKELLNKINIDEAYNNDSVHEISGIDGIFDDK